MLIKPRGMFRGFNRGSMMGGGATAGAPAVELIFDETFEGAGYAEGASGITGGWAEDPGSGGTPILDEDFDTGSVPGGTPSGWGSQCLKVVPGTSGTTTVSCTFDSPQTILYGRLDVVFHGYGGLVDGNNLHFFWLLSSSNWPISICVSRSGSNYSLKCYYNDGADFQGPIAGPNISLDTPYRIDFKWQSNTADTGVDFRVSTSFPNMGSSLGTATSGNLSGTGIVIADVAGAHVAAEFYYDNIQLATDGYCP